MNEEVKVPAGLKKFKKCGCYKGKCPQDGEKWVVTRCCKSDICERCKTPVYRYKIASDYYDEDSGRCWHVPIWRAWVHKCSEGVNGQLQNSFLIDPRTGKDLLHPKQ